MKIQKIKKGIGLVIYFGGVTLLIVSFFGFALVNIGIHVIIDQVGTPQWSNTLVHLAYVGNQLSAIFSFLFVIGFLWTLLGYPVGILWLLVSERGWKGAMEHVRGMLLNPRYKDPFGIAEEKKINL